MTQPKSEPTTDDAASWVRAPDPEGDATIEENWLFRLRRERFQSRASGKAHGFYVMHLADAVNVIALTTDDQVIFVRQFRAGSARDSLEPPGGLLDDGEDPRTAATRELLEETGYAGESPQLLGSAYSNPSILSSRIFVVVVRNARRVAEPTPDAGEEVAVELVPARLVPGLLRDRKIDHALSVMALLWWLAAEPGRTSRRRFTIKDWMACTAVLACALGALMNLENPVVGVAFAFGALGVVLGLGAGRA